MVIDLANDFSPYPSGRVERDGEWHGTKFRREVLIPAITHVMESGQPDAQVIIDIDGVRSFGSSFFEEALGGLNREPDLDALAALRTLQVKCTQPSLKLYKDTVESVLDEALKEAQKQ